MKKILVVLLVFAIALSSCNNETKNTNSDNNPISTGDSDKKQNDEVTNNKKDETNPDNEADKNSENEDKDTISLTSELVVLDVGDNKDITANTCRIKVDANEKYESFKKTIEEINTWIEDTAKKDLEMLFEYAEMDSESDIEKYYSIEDNISFIRQDEKYVSFSLLRYENTGGPHPSTMGEGFTIDVDSGKRLTLRDIVSNPDDLYDIIIDKLNKHEAKPGFYENYEGVIKNLFYSKDSTEFQLVWVIDSRTLYITFEPYTIAPYASGPININISFNEVDNLFIDKIKDI